MKMGVGTRIIFSVFILIILAVCAGVFLTTLGLIDYAIVEPVVNAFTDPVGKYVCAGVAVVLFVVGVCLLFFGIKKAPPAAVTLVSDANGSVSLSLQAIEELSLRCLTEIQGIIVQKISIIPATHALANIRIRVEFCVKAGVEMPGLSENIKKTLKEYIEKYSGLMVDAIDLRVIPYKAPTYPTMK